MNDKVHIPPSRALVATGASVLVFVVALYAWGVVTVLATDPSPAGAGCEMPSTEYIPMESPPRDLGTEAVDWLPVPATTCTHDGVERSLESRLFLLSFPVGLFAAAVTFWGVGRSSIREELEWAEV
jgi:hypothetical protein